MDIENFSNDKTPVDLFLENIGLSEYSKLMKSNDINDIKILSELTESDFEKMGITSLGHRKTLLKSLRDELEPNDINTTVELLSEDSDKKKGGGVWAVVGVLLVIILAIIIVGAL